jgi:uncharacterized protein YfaS (alpha-2-macroglobulin family)
VLLGLTLLGRDAETGALLDDVAADLSSGEWFSTQSLAFALVAVAQNTGAKPFKGFSFDYSTSSGAGQTRSTVKGESPVASVNLPAPAVAGLPLELRNTSDRKLYVTAAVRATPASGEEDASANGLSVDVAYGNAEGKLLDVSRLAQGSDLIAQVTIKNLSKRRLDNLALSQLVPAGWEIRNDRLEDVNTAGERSQHDLNLPGRYWWVPSEWRRASMPMAEYTDIRDDRVQRYFSLGPGEQIFFETRLNAAYLGRFYLPGAGIEAMYDAKVHARRKGQWVEVVPAGRPAAQ